MVNFKYVHKSEESKVQDDFLSRPSQDIILTTCKIWANSEVASFSLLKLENGQKGVQYNLTLPMLPVSS